MNPVDWKWKIHKINFDVDIKGCAIESRRGGDMIEQELFKRARE